MIKIVEYTMAAFESGPEFKITTLETKNKKKKL
jgi:hypothetical protein